MRVTEKMVVAAAKIAPMLSSETVRKMLEAAMAGNIIFADGIGKGEPAIDSSPCSQIHLQLNFTDPHRALECSEQLLYSARRCLLDKERSNPIIFMLSGDAELSHVDR